MLCTCISTEPLIPVGDHTQAQRPLASLGLLPLFQRSPKRAITKSVTQDLQVLRSRVQASADERRYGNALGLHAIRPCFIDLLHIPRQIPELAGLRRYRGGTCSRHVHYLCTIFRCRCNHLPQSAARSKTCHSPPRVRFALR